MINHRIIVNEGEVGVNWGPVDWNIYTRLQCAMSVWDNNSRKVLDDIVDRNKSGRNPWGRRDYYVTKHGKFSVEDRCNYNRCDEKYFNDEINDRNKEAGKLCVDNKTFTKICEPVEIKL